MAKICYALAGEGRGHASRARTVVEHLLDRHEFVLYTSDDAFAFLEPLYRENPRVSVRQVPGIVFQYTNGRIDLLKTIRKGFEVRKRLGSVVEKITAEVRKENPALVITDFEPFVPRAAHRAGIPVLSLDHQHFLVAYDLSILPWNLRYHAWVISWALWMYGMRPDRIAVSAFYFPPLARKYRHIDQLGPLLRPELEKLEPVRGDFILSYLRKCTPESMVQTLIESGERIRIYGLGNRPPVGKVTFHGISAEAFAVDLAGCRALIAAAGNQLLGEAMYFRKPVLAVPEARHHEQLINAHFLRWQGGGDFVALEAFSAQCMASFLARIDTFHEDLARRPRPNGPAQALEIINSMIEASAPAGRQPVAVASEV